MLFFPSHACGDPVRLRVTDAASDMHDWNAVHLNYCDGGSFAGHREEALQVKVSSTEQARYGAGSLHGGGELWR